MKVQGNIKVINDTVQVSEKFAKREVVVTTNDTYPQEILVQFTQDKCGVLDSYKVGENVSIDINLRGRSWLSPILLGVVEGCAPSGTVMTGSAQRHWRGEVVKAVLVVTNDAQVDRKDRPVCLCGSR